MTLSEEQLIANYERYKGLLLGTGEHRRGQLEAMIDHFDDRLVLCPASSKVQFHACYPGGLVDHSLRVLRNAQRMAKVSPDLYADLPAESVVFSALLHDIGKLGTLEKERYGIQNNRYYYDKGNHYEIEENMPPARDLSLFLLHHFGVKMTYDEWEAILLNDGPSLEANKDRGYRMKETNLTLLIHQADRLSCQQEKE